MRRRSARIPPFLRTLLILLTLSLSAACVNPQGSAASRADVGSAGATGLVAGRPAKAPHTADVLPDPGAKSGECTMVTYTPASTKEAWNGELCRPASGQRDVAVVLVHGGSGVSGDRTALKPWATRLTAEGYVTFAIDYHLFKAGYANQSPVFPWPELNVKAAVQFVRGVGNAIGVDKDRIVVQGHSAGARVGAEAFVSPDDTWYAGYLGGGSVTGAAERWPSLSDKVNGFIGFYHPYDGTMQYADQYYGGAEKSSDAKARERWAKADSITNADHAAGPALFVTGDKDWSLIFAQESAFAEQLKKKGLAADSLAVPGGGHGFDEGSPTRLSKLGEQALTKVLAFLNDHFGQDPARPAQSAPADLAGAPANTGVVPPSYTSRVDRPYPNPTAGPREGGPTTPWGSTPTSHTPPSPPTSTAPPISTTPTSSTPPSSVTPTTPPPPTSTPPTTLPPTTVPPTTTRP